MKKYARIDGDFIYAVDINIDPNYLPENVKEVNFTDPKIQEINENPNLLSHNLSGSLNKINVRLNDELNQLVEELHLEEDIDPLKVMTATARFAKGKARPEDEELLARVEKIEEKKDRIAYIKNRIIVKEKRFKVKTDEEVDNNATNNQ